jgi:hypothetical protein
MSAFDNDFECPLTYGRRSLEIRIPLLTHSIEIVNLTVAAPLIIIVGIVIASF